MQLKQSSSVIAALLGAAFLGGCELGTVHYPNGPHPELMKLDWLVGDWSTEPGNTIAATEEHWMTPSSRNMFGIGRTLKGGQEVFMEYLRITTDRHGLVYYAAPDGRLPATPFHAVEYGPERAIFENLEHDFPQRIVYELLPGGEIRARIEGEVDGEMKSSQWTLRRIS